MVGLFCLYLSLELFSRSHGDFFKVRDLVLEPSVHKISKLLNLSSVWRNDSDIFWKNLQHNDNINYLNIHCWNRKFWNPARLPNHTAFGKAKTGYVNNLIFMFHWMKIIVKKLYLLLVREQLFEVVDNDHGLLGVEERRASLLALVFTDNSMENHRETGLRKAFPSANCNTLLASE